MRDEHSRHLGLTAGILFRGAQPFAFYLQLRWGKPHRTSGAKAALPTD